MGVEEGLFTGDSEETFLSRREIMKKLALEGEFPPITFDSGLTTIFDVNRYLDEADKRAQSIKELSTISEHRITVSIPDTSIISIFADTHIGDLNTINQRLKQELEVIRNTPNSYVILAGDLVNGIFWGGESGGEQVLNLSEQHMFLRAFFRSLNGKIIAATSGEHDSKWASKSGMDPYQIMLEESGTQIAPYIRGVAELKLNVGEQEYYIVFQHKAKGHSMYNKNHPTMREARFGVQGGDIYISGHTHQKGLSEEAIHTVIGSKKITHISVGPYKTGDSYGQREGFPSMDPEEMFGASIRLHADRHYIERESDILEAHKKW